MNLRSLVDVQSSARARRRLVGAAGALLLLCASACGASSVASSSAGAPNGGAVSSLPEVTAAPGGTHQFSATLTVTGAVTKSASFTELIGGRPACAAFAQAGINDGSHPSVWYLPNNSDYTFLMTWDILTYHGPATYTDQSTMSVDLTAGGQQFVVLTPTSSTLSVTVKADGSGSATFANLQNQATKAAVSGSETWTCS
jgi:hypothetical protein